MRKITVLEFIALDGVIQAGGFEYGGWAAPYGDEIGGTVVQEELKQTADYLLG